MTAEQPAGNRGRCPVCGEALGAQGDLIRAWPGQYAHRDCASYERRGQP